MCPEKMLFIYYWSTIGRPGYPNVAMPFDGGVYTYSISEVQRLTNSWVYKELILYLNI